MESVAFLVPLAVGVKSICMLQLAPGRTWAGRAQGVAAKSPLFVPVIEMLEIARVAVPVLVMLTCCEALVVPTG